MSNIKASVIADSINKFGNRITTVMVTFPRIILAETNTHRALSRNSASSRAIPFRKMVETMFGEMNMRFTPIAWQKDHPGMQGTEYFTEPEKVKRLEEIWDQAAKNALESALELSSEGVTKQLCNRLLEPFMWHTVLITATEWNNFFALRAPCYYIAGDKNDVPFTEGRLDFRSSQDLVNELGTPDVVMKARRECTSEDAAWLSLNVGQAEIHMMALAEAIWDARNESKPTELKEGEWHIPFGDEMDEQLIYDYLTENDTNGEGFRKQSHANAAILSAKVKIATARCARVSYTLPGSDSKIPDYEADIKLHDRLASSGHWSPFEHCAKVMSEEEFGSYSVSVPSTDKTVVDNKTNWLVPINNFASPNLEVQGGWCGNFRGFIQYRKTFDNENIV